MDSTRDSRGSRASADDDVQNISRSLRTDSQEHGVPLPDSRDAVGMEGHRNMMLASLLEDYYRSRALEFLTAANPGQSFTRQSREVEAVARRLYAQASDVLSASGLVSAMATSEESQAARRQYLAGLNSIVATPSIAGSMRELVATPAQLDLAPHPPRSHYRATFREDRLLGKGGFGKVYQCYNILDQKTYAVKKIILPPKLVKSLSDGKHDDLQHVLREVQAMAMLDHPNIVRYHATWFEEPPQLPGLPGEIGKLSRPPTQGQQLLIESQPFDYFSDRESSASGGIVFAEDTVSHPSGMGGAVDANDNWTNLGWSENATPALDDVDSFSASGSSIFTGGRGDSARSTPRQSALEANSHALYIQMSLYPMTLSQFISPAATPGLGVRHCFHLVPTLRLMTSIHEGLQYIHSKGLVHRDIKPGNIFLSSPVAGSEGGYCSLRCKQCADAHGESSDPMWLNPRIGDFGLVHQLAQCELPSSSSASSAAASTTPELTNGAGTAYYQPPRKGDVKDEKIDIFALGVVFVEMLCRCDTAMERVGMLKDLQNGKLSPDIRRNIRAEGHTPDIEEQVMRLLSAMIEGDPEQRWSGSQVREALRDILGKCDN
ncbi:kinase-like protein [Xylariaceae sp. FL0594]|nr:kinase-like protein [Xylariaceae sp. FL0594]